MSEFDSASGRDSTSRARHIFNRLLCVLAVLSAAAPAAAQPSGAASCSGCHAGAGPVPGLEGRQAAEIVAAMAAFRSGERPVTVMDRIGKGFTDDETRAIADWLAGRQDHARP